MLHPSYTDLMTVVNSEVEPGEEKVVNSRYSIVLATAKRARQIIDGAEPMVGSKCPKPLSIAVDEVYNSKVRILTEEEVAEEERIMEEARLAREAVEADMEETKEEETVENEETEETAGNEEEAVALDEI